MVCPKELVLYGGRKRKVTKDLQLNSVFCSKYDSLPNKPQGRIDIVLAKRGLYLCSNLDDPRVLAK